MTEVQITWGEPGRCYRCGEQSAFSAWVPHEWLLSNGRHTTGGRRAVPLCLTCDLADPDSGPLALFLRCHPELTAGGTVTDEVFIQFIQLLDAWIPKAKVPVVSEADWNADLEAYRRGEFD